ncbi:MAG: Mov34/MPN/PAD-1 family protein [Methanocorpusculum sp.]|uniref:Mov34/MPN/PAD-1 family protein n=1 Tax=Methanocorpusculum petauri TaxID=3002863 RepID=A0ABT4IHD2_9EURY|nr:Mov34/MPN/PAD-1 family protein [Methanocorpusculum petauri]MCZ9312077.1 Mov34/MPN/PAD-1 family protein [Methanocorpusculum sp.]MCZ0861156.1 Mov34/MPN/PAD-1 family protein [Methanocorpusculum petauri]MDE2443423.1 Mov34/MPN/PAD-1 family protein [Methanocorpusculum sp.]MDE2518714.1 Mov34/MPN/PAD-1 family protein [Methanocorpusculum sp.]MDE2522579.1 Mov34/MPN/PAD-1 family protein [Methanocorpusculum sp.]
MFVRAIDREVLDLLLEMGKSSFPDEFIVMLGSEKGVITTVYPIAGTTVTSDSATIFMDMVPLGMQIAGTAHSHPNGALWPSDADLQTFAETGQCHIIVGDPFAEDSWRCFDREGHTMSLEVVSA